MKNLKSITLYTQIHQFCDNQSRKLLRLPIFSWKSLKNVWLSQRHPEFPLVHDSMLEPSLEKLCQAANLRPIMNKGAGGASLTIFVTECNDCDTSLRYLKFPKKKHGLNNSRPQHFSFQQAKYFINSIKNRFVHQITGTFYHWNSVCFLLSCCR